MCCHCEGASLVVLSSFLSVSKLKGILEMFFSCKRNKLYMLFDIWISTLYQNDSWLSRLPVGVVISRTYWWPKTKLIYSFAGGEPSVSHYFCVKPCVSGTHPCLFSSCWQCMAGGSSLGSLFGFIEPFGGVCQVFLSVLPMTHLCLDPDQMI